MFGVNYGWLPSRNGTVSWASAGARYFVVRLPNCKHKGFRHIPIWQRSSMGAPVVVLVAKVEHSEAVSHRASTAQVLHGILKENEAF